MDKIANLLINRTVDRINNIVQPEISDAQEQYQMLVKHRRSIAADIEAERMDKARESWYYTY